MAEKFSNFHNVFHQHDRYFIFASLTGIVNSILYSFKFPCFFSVKPSACELRVAQYEKPLTKGHCPVKTKSEIEKRDPEKLAKKRSERRERSHQLKEKIIKLIESGLQLSEYQARKVKSYIILFVRK